MEESKKTVKTSEIISFIGVIILTLFTFLGAHYCFAGNYVISILIGLATLIFIPIYIQLMIKVKLIKRDRAMYNVIEPVLVFLYIIVFVSYTSIFLAHFLSVETTQKTMVQNAMKKQLEEGQNLFPTYEKYVDDRAVMYTLKLDNALKEAESKVSGYKNNLQNLGFDLNRSNLEGQKDILVETFKNKMKDGYDGLKSEADKYISKSNKSIKVWSWLKIPGIVKETESKVKQWTDKIVEMSKYDKSVGAFSYNLSASEDILSSITTINPRNFSWILTIIAIFVLNTLILWPYIFGGRSKRKKGVKGEQDDSITINMFEENKN